MDRRSILWILAFGVVLIQARHRNPNTNMKSNMFRRNMNTNMNMNSNTDSRGRRPSRRPAFDDDIEYFSPVEKYPSSRSVDGDSTKIAALATAAADAAMAVTKNLANGMSEAAAIAVGDAVARILTFRLRRSDLGRRSSNINTNYNLNLLGGSSLTDNQEPQPLLEHDVMQGSASAGLQGLQGLQGGVMQGLEGGVLQDLQGGAMQDLQGGAMQDLQGGVMQELRGGVIQEPSGNLNSKYILFPGRDLDRSKWMEPDFSEQEWDYERNDIDRKVRKPSCTYKSSSCGMRRKRPIVKMELMDDLASEQHEESTTSDFLFNGEDLENDKEFMEGGKESTIDKELFLELNDTTTSEPTPARRSKNRNMNQNQNTHNNNRRSYIPKKN